MSVYAYKEKPHRMRMFEVRELEYLIECYRNGTRSEEDAWIRFLQIMKGEGKKD